MQQIERIDVVATIIYSGDHFLTVYNQNWGAFTLPMTKLRNWQLGLSGAGLQWERGADAAVRNVAECLGKLSIQAPGLLLDVGGISQSDRSGRINHYQFQIYAVESARAQAGPHVASEWLTADEILDEQRRPISPTARRLVAELMQASLNRGGRFPPVHSPGSMRTSVASMAVISQTEGAHKRWLCQWNKHWCRYFLVGGHEKAGETAAECMVREIEEELGLSAGVDYEPLSAATPLRCTDWSTSAWRMTDYSISIFDVKVNEAALSKVTKDAANRWVTADEIRSERCSDGKLISPTTCKVLGKLRAI